MNDLDQSIKLYYLYRIIIVIKVATSSKNEEPAINYNHPHSSAGINNRL